MSKKIKMNYILVGNHVTAGENLLVFENNKLGIIKINTIYFKDITLILGKSYEISLNIKL